MKYRIIQRKNPQDPQAAGLFYANAVNEGKFSLSDFVGVQTAEEFNVSLIKDVKVIFTPGVELKAALKDIRFDRS
jgi:hypothetical protein